MEITFTIYHSTALFEIKLNLQKFELYMMPELKRESMPNLYMTVGPALQPLLYDILIRVRLHKSVLIGSIKKAFLQIEVVP